MDFAPPPSTANYERYASESESTDGEGDVSGGQSRHRQIHGPLEPTTVNKEDDGYVAASEREGERSHANGSSTKDTRSRGKGTGGGQSIFSKLTGGYYWTAGTTGSSRGTAAEAQAAGYAQHQHYQRRHHHRTSSNRHRNNGGTLWKDIKEGGSQGDAGGGMGGDVGWDERARVGGENIRR